MIKSHVSTSFIKEITSQDTGGGMDCDVVYLNDGTILVISEAAIVLYPDELSWEGSAATVIGTVLRASSELMQAGELLD